MLLAIVVVLLAHAEGPSCPTKNKMNQHMLQPEVIKGFLRTHKVTSADDMVCCLASIPGLEIVISPHSVAAQNGDYQNPRVLMMSRDSNGEINAIFSVNSGKIGLNQNNSVEMMFNDRGKGEAVFTDIDFTSGKPHVSERNPETCMLCHGDSGAVPVGGPRLIFDVAPWSRFIMGSQLDDRLVFGQFLCPERQKLEPLFVQEANKALATKPRYSCLKDLPRASLSAIDGGLQLMQVRQIVKTIRASPNYQQFKFAIAAAEICGDFIPEHYIPADVLSTLTDQETLAKGVRGIASGSELLRHMDAEHSRLRAEADARDRAKRGLAQKIAAGQPIDLGDEIRDSLNCSMPGDSDFKLADMPNAANLFFSSKNMIFNRYVADTSLHQGGGAATRFLFEARGINVSRWEMTPSGGYSRGFNLIEALMNRESKGSTLRRTVENRDSGDPKVACERLKALSLKAFEGFELGSPNSGVDQAQ